MTQLTIVRLALPCEKCLLKSKNAGFAATLFTETDPLYSGMATLTSVQRQAIPALLGGADTVAVAPTGSGKTLAYVLPAVPHILAQDPLKVGQGPIALVLLPTRELAIQVETVRSDPCFGHRSPSLHYWCSP